MREIVQCGYVVVVNGEELRVAHGMCTGDSQGDMLKVWANWKQSEG